MHSIDRPAFRNLLHSNRPSLTEQDIPHRPKLRKEIIERAKCVETRESGQKLKKDNFKGIPDLSQSRDVNVMERDVLSLLTGICSGVLV